MNIIITGASKGIGYAIVKEFGKIGNHNIIAIARDHSRLQELKNSFDGSQNSQLHIIAFDLSEKNYQKVLFKNIDDAFKLSEGGKIDVLINNAGYLINKPFQELDIEEWEQIFSVNLYAAVKLIKLLYPYFNDKSKSHIVNIGSMAGFQGTEKFPGLS
ncbi:MAG: SDR family NAD(P)-dependent oxidoreductase, partial [Bacteroidetes bacterium]|nr:SDR family NAD(P)-dependent oxidoreductase [Bacteroidota bacterium]